MADTIWHPVRYGWGRVYWLTIEGCDTVWSEGAGDGVATGLTLPSGYATEDPSLVIDSSAKVGSDVDKDRGIGRGFPLTFELRDSDEVASWIKRPTYSGRLTADLSATATTATVDDTTGSPASPGQVVIGAELVSYTGKTATTFTGLTRGVAGWAYAHEAKGAGAEVSEVPRWWLGRQVTLWASPIDTSGYMPGSTLSDDAEQLLRLFISAGPKRVRGGWRFEALALDRILDRPLIAAASGKVVSSELRVPVQTGLLCQAYFKAVNGSGTTQFEHWIQWQPFASDSDGDLLSATDIIARIEDGFANAVTAAAATGDLEALKFYWSDSSYGGLPPSYGVKRWVGAFTFDANASATYIEISLDVFGQMSSHVGIQYPAGVAATDHAIVNWTFGANPLTPNQVSINPAGHLTVLLDEGDPAGLPSTGAVKVGDDVYTYTSAETAQGMAYLGGLTPVTPGLQPPISFVGLDVEFIFVDEQKLDALILRAIHSSGTSGLRDATYDQLDGELGYGLHTDLVHQDSITGLLTEDWLGGLTLSGAYSGRSLVDVVSGVLAMSQRALVVRQDRDETNAPAKLTAVHVGPAGGGFASTVGQEDIIGGGNEPVEVTEVPTAPNSIRVQVELAGEHVQTIIANDKPRMRAQGTHAADFTMPLAESTAGVPEGAPLAIASWAQARFAADQQASRLTLRVVPWITAQAGDLVKVTTTHAGVWDHKNNQPGFDGVGRCVAHARDLETGELELQVHIDGQLPGTALCPQAPVTTWAGTAAAPTTIDIPALYYLHFSAALTDQGGNIEVTHYKPGDAAANTGHRYTISAAQVVSGVCRLTVASVTSTHSLDSSSYLSVPDASNSTDYQDLFMHDGDGTRWS